jgi:hypothetical protein
VVAIDSANGKPAWEIDVAKLATLEVVRGGEVADAGATVQPQPNIARRQMFVNGGVVQVVGNGQVVVNGVAVDGDGNANVPPPPADRSRAPAHPAPPVAGAGEQVVDVRPVGDRVLVTTTTGRVLAADIANGSVAWQIRLAEGTPDRVVATEDFTVVRSRDDAAVRLFALDTYSGRVIGRQAFALSGNNVPLNLALSPDGKLVYTLPDQLRMRDLYDGWTDQEKSYSPNPPNGAAVRLFEGATQPGQLIIAEGRILALADNAAAPTSDFRGSLASQKYVSVFSLETLLPIPLAVDGGGNVREMNQMLTTETTEWSATLQSVGSRLYVLSKQRIHGYDLEQPGLSWAGAIGGNMDPKESSVSLRDAFIGNNYVVLLDQPTNENDPPFRLTMVGRYPVGDQRRESGKINGHYSVLDASRSNPQWQAANGGFYYTTADGQVKVLFGTEKKP